jgi:hypothetical protein
VRGRGYGHCVRRIGTYTYRLTWLWDRKYTGSRLRYPTRITRDTDLAGAKRFAARWRVPILNEAAYGPEGG